MQIEFTSLRKDEFTKFFYVYLKNIPVYIINERIAEGGRFMCIAGYECMVIVNRRLQAHLC